MEETSKRKKVLCPIESKNGGKTYWRTMGIAYVNKDNSINLYLDALPTNGKLHVRDWDEKDDAPRRSDVPAQYPLRSLPGGADGGGPGSPGASAGEDLPF